jgi:quinol monooxygenase YgiN
MYGLILKMTIVPGKRNEMIDLLKSSASNMPGCFSYVVAEDSAVKNILWVTEVRDTVANHDGSLLLPAVQRVIPQAKAMVANFEKIATTDPVWGVGLPPAHAQ